jgi:hypothetical protein
MFDLINKEILIIISSIVTIYLLLQNFDLKIIVILLVILYFFKEYYKDFKEKTKDMIENKNDPKKFYKDYNLDIEQVLKGLKKYRKNNKQNYREGLHYWKLFMKQIKELEHKDLFNYSQYFDKAEMYLKKSVNSFQGIIISSEERNLLDGVKYNNYDYSKDLSNLIKDLYKQGYLLLYNFSLRYNEKWEKDPNTFNKQIILDYPFPTANDHDNHEYF